MSLSEQKVWGITTPIYRTPLCEMHHLQILPLARCSKHLHLHKHNVFVVLQGELFIDVWEHEDSAAPQSTRIGPHRWFTVAPGKYHQFRTGSTPCNALEIYYPEALSEDIIRDNIGSRIDEHGHDRQGD